ncbi:MAG: prepilin-type N-terminal cleavage/methylation domain-containing protein [Candidatus Riflebacteria bacterium]|nr:prepilin-type N-terminal cleavage/methylation domain-containing protein [Candidatus Riflebacteria bacterium]
MRLNRRSRLICGFTLIELIICILLMTILIAGASTMLSGSLKSGQKGAAHLTIVQNSMVLISQLQFDLQRASAIFQPAVGAVTQESMFEVWGLDTSGKLSTSTIIYKPTPNQKGFSRSRLDSTGSTVEEHVFCKENIAVASFTHIQDSNSGKVGVVATFNVRSLPPATEELTLKRYIFCPCLASNSRAVGWKGP